jgi:hypothetical protein
MTDTGTAKHVIANSGSVHQALRRAAAAARREYVCAGLAMPVWRSGHLVWIEPTELARYEADGDSETRTPVPPARRPAPYGDAPA